MGKRSGCSHTQTIKALSHSLIEVSLLMGKFQTQKSNGLNLIVIIFLSAAIARCSVEKRLEQCGFKNGHLPKINPTLQSRITKSYISAKL